METAKNKFIELYPSNWLYNAGVVGFLFVLERSKLNVNNLLLNDGTVRGDINQSFSDFICSLSDDPHDKGFVIPEFIWNWFLLSGIKLKDDFDENGSDPIKDIWGKLFNSLYRGFFNANSNYLYKKSKKTPAILKSFLVFTESLFTYQKNNPVCPFCNKRGSKNHKNDFSSEHFRELGGSDGNKGMPNSFWNNKKETGSTALCDTCSFIFLNKHLSFVNLNYRSEIFINAPSFKIMYHLNKFLKEISGVNNTELRSKRELLAMSVIEYATRIKTTLGQWSTMNIEIVTKTVYKIDKKWIDEIDFFAIPNDVMQLLTNRNIAGQLKTIGEFSILNLVLDRKYNRLTDVGYRLMREAMKSSNRNYDYINKWIYSKSNQQRIDEVAQQILKLYVLIEERTTQVNKFSKNKEYAN